MLYLNVHYSWTAWRLDSKTRNVSSFRTKSLFCMWHAGRMTLVAICTLWENGESPVVQVNLSSRTAVSLWDAMVADAYWELANEKCKRDGIALGKLRRCLDTCSSHQSSGQTGFSLSSLGQQRAFATALMGKWHCALNDSCRTVIVMMFSKSLWCEINIYIYILSVLVVPAMPCLRGRTWEVSWPQLVVDEFILSITYWCRLRAEPGDPGNKGHFLLNRKIPQAP